MRLMRESSNAQPCPNGSTSATSSPRQGQTMIVCRASTASICKCAPSHLARSAEYEYARLMLSEMYECYRSALERTVNGGEDRTPDLWGLPDDGAVPRLYVFISPNLSDPRGQCN